MKRILVTGINGLLGQKCTILMSKRFDLFGCDIQEDSYSQNNSYQYIDLDITNRDDVRKIILEIKPELIINTAAYTNVDGCEKHKELCWKTNVEGVQHLAYAAGKIDARIIHISTDYIFDGQNGPYKEDDTPNPLGYYGKSKLASENALIESNIDFAVLRTMILFGAGVNIRLNFVTWLIQKLKNGESVNIVNDQFGNPTIAEDLAKAIECAINHEKSGFYHVAGSEYIDRYSFALKVADVFKLDASLIHPVTTAELNQAAARPMRSGFILDKMKNELGFETMNVEDSLKILKKQMKTHRFFH
ncbi:MAG: dTDP-4-dehydrorhamnose reductase [candidate division KSB1 bacterium]|jgi:dTDP-4-dehydrorhamnose reductase|nr:dTDP-4-dehydrorhamnose reductase [candidate division KSB1 bacterium]